MNIPLALKDAIRRLRGSLRVIEKRTYVFILVPFDFRRNGRARSAQLEQHLIGNSRYADNPRSNALFLRSQALIALAPEQLPIEI